MSERKPEGPYVYQPHAPNTEHGERIYGVGGVGLLTRIDGLTKHEAQIVAAALAKTDAIGRIAAAVNMCDRCENEVAQVCTDCAANQAGRGDAR